MIYRKVVENIDLECLGCDGEYLTAVDVGRDQDGHRCVGDSDNTRVLFEVVGFLGMHVQNAQLGYIIEKLLNRQWFESFRSSQEERGRL